MLLGCPLGLTLGLSQRPPFPEGVLGQLGKVVVGSGHGVRPLGWLRPPCLGSGVAQMAGGAAAVSSQGFLRMTFDFAHYLRLLANPVICLASGCSSMSLLLSPHVKVISNFYLYCNISKDICVNQSGCVCVLHLEKKIFCIRFSW